MVAGKNFIVHFDLESGALDDVISPMLLPAIVKLPVRFYAIDLGPPRARLSLLQHFLI